MHKRRMVISMTLAAAALCVFIAILVQPGRVGVPAVVEYAPLSVVRAAAPGFVTEICVASGDTVVAGQPIVVLRNDELQAELADLELALSESLIKSRMLIQAHDIGKAANGSGGWCGDREEDCRAENPHASLTVRAAVAGQVYARNFAALGDDISSRARRLRCSAARRPRNSLLPCHRAMSYSLETIWAPVRCDSARLRATALLPGW